MASIRKLGELWQVQLFKKRVRKSATFKTLQEAEAWAQSTEDKIDSFGIHESATKITGYDLTRIYVRAKENARQRAIEFQIKRDDIVALYALSHGRCQVTNIAFNTYRPYGSSKRPWFPSVDRIDSGKPYTVENCRLVCVAVNIGMGEWGEWVLRTVAEAMVLGQHGSLQNGPEGQPYRFAPIKGEPSYRQAARRKARKGNPPKTHQPQAEINQS